VRSLLKKGEIATLLNSSINLFADYIEFGFEGEHNEVCDFDYFDRIVSETLEKKDIDLHSLVYSQTTKTQTPFLENNEDYKSNEKEFDDSSLEIIKKRALIKLSGEISLCNRCGILANNQKAVSGFSNPDAKILVISDYPNGEDEKNNSHLSGEVGDFFKKWIEAIKVDYNELYITTIVKCNIQNGSISPQVLKNIIESCDAHLEKEIAIISPKLIFVLGEFVLSSIFKKNLPMKTNHGKFFMFNNIPLIATYNPKEVLVDSSLKQDVWNDLKILKKFYDNKIANG